MGTLSSKLQDLIQSYIIEKFTKSIVNRYSQKSKFKFILWGVSGFASLYMINSLFFKTWRRVRFYTKQGIQREYNFPLFGIFAQFRQDYFQHNDYQYSCKNYLQINQDRQLFVTHIYDKPLLFIFDQDMIKQILHNPTDYPKTEFGVEHFHRLIRKGFTFLEGEKWKGKRKIVSQLFTNDNMMTHFQDFLEITQQSMPLQLLEKKLNVTQFFEQLVGNLILNFVIGWDYKTTHSKENILWEQYNLSQAIMNVEQSLLESILTLDFLIFGNTFKNLGLRQKDRQTNRRIRDLRSFVTNLIIKEKQNFTSGDQSNIKHKLTIFSAFCQAKDLETDEDIQELVDIILNSILAGIDTTSRFLSMAVYYLATLPNVKENLLKEIKSMNQQLTPENLKQYTYLDSFCKEVSRHYGPAPFLFIREPKKDIQLGQYNIKKGTLLTVGILYNHYNPKYFEQPQLFSPERWVDKAKQIVNDQPFCYLPFSGGSRNCIGQHLAMLDAKIALIYFLRSYPNFTLDSKYQLKLIFKSSYEPQEDIIINLE